MKSSRTFCRTVKEVQVGVEPDCKLDSNQDVSQVKSQLREEEDRHTKIEEYKCSKTSTLQTLQTLNDMHTFSS